MSDLISRQAAIKTAIEWYDTHFRDGESVAGLATGLKNLPSAQPEIIRCKDCKHHYAKSLLCKVWSKYGTVATLDTDYCSYAERITDGTDEHSDIG